MVCVLCTSKRDGPGRRAMVLCVVEVWRRRTFGTSDSEPRTRSCCCRSPVPAHPGGSRCQIRVFFSRLTSGATCTFFSINVTKKDFSQRQKSPATFSVSLYTFSRSPPQNRPIFLQFPHRHGTCEPLGNDNRDTR